jgi:hypothetical protein
MGKEAFLAKEAERFDRDYATPRPVGFYAIGGTFLLGSCFILYELIALGALEILNKCSKEDTSRGSPPPV